MRTEQIIFTRCLHDLKTHAPAKAKEEKKVNATPDTYIPPATVSLPAALISLNAMASGLRKVETVAHSLGEAANESWIRIWTIRGQLDIGFDMHAAGIAPTHHSLDKMARELKAIEVGLSAIKSEVKSQRPQAKA